MNLKLPCHWIANGNLFNFVKLDVAYSGVSVVTKEFFVQHVIWNLNTVRTLIISKGRQSSTVHHLPVVMEIWFRVQFIVLAFYRIWKSELGSFTSECARIRCSAFYFDLICFHWHEMFFLFCYAIFITFFIAVVVLESEKFFFVLIESLVREFPSLDWIWNSMYSNDYRWSSIGPDRWVGKGF